jgi:hypothetical protein
LYAIEKKLLKACATAQLNPEAVCEHLERVLLSTSFARSERVLAGRPLETRSQAEAEALQVLQI